MFSVLNRECYFKLPLRRALPCDFLIVLDDFFATLNSFTHNPLVKSPPVNSVPAARDHQQSLLERLRLIPRSCRDKPVHYRVRRCNYPKISNPGVGPSTAQIQVVPILMGLYLFRRSSMGLAETPCTISSLGDRKRIHVADLYDGL